MQFSCKITSSVLNYLESIGEDVSPLLDITSVSPESLRDSSQWLVAPEVERFLELLLSLPLKKRDLGLIEKIGHEVPYLRSWGILDSVLRMMPNSQEAFHKPERFLSYFIFPEPPVENIIRKENYISFLKPRDFRVTKSGKGINIFSSHDEYEVAEELFRMDKRGLFGHTFKMPRYIKKLREP